LKRKYTVFLILFLLLIACLFRVYTAAVVPFIPDEEDQIGFIKNISFAWDDLRLPIGNRVMQNPLLCSYVVKLTVDLFGQSQLGIRLVFILLGTLGLFFIYKLVEENIETKTALLSLFLLAFSQYHIGVTRFAYEGALSFFFMPLAFYTFLQGLKTQQTKYVMYTAVLIGFGILAYEAMTLFAFALFLYLLIKNGFWFRRKEFYFSLLISFLIISPYLFWSYNNAFSKLSSEHFFEFGFSLRSFYLYFAELLPLFNQFIPVFVWDLKEESIYYITHGGEPFFLSATSNELPVIHWPLGILIVIGFLYCLKQRNKNEFISFCLFLFSFVFISTSLIAGSHSLFDDHWWAGITLFPGVILCSHMLIDILNKYRFFKFMIAGLIIYFFLHALYFINLPESQFALPKKDLYAYYLDRAEIYQTAGRSGLAMRRCRWVLSKTQDKTLVERAENILSKIQH